MKSKSRNLGYPVGWKGTLSPEMQVAYFRRELPDLKLDGSCVPDLARGLKVPTGWDGIAVVPKTHTLANLVAIKTYDNIRALHSALGGLYSRNHAWVQYDPHKHGRALDGLRADPNTARAVSKLAGQPGDFMVFAVQLGKAWPDAWVGSVGPMLREGEFFLDPYLAACILFIHTERLADFKSSGISCPGATTPNGLVPHIDCVRHDLRGQEADNVILKFHPANVPRWIATGLVP